MPLPRLRPAVAPLLLLCCAAPSSAVPLGRIDTFDKAPLDERVWQLAYGEPASVQVSDGKLKLTPSRQTIRLTRRFYPLRSEGERPDFGDFRVSMKLAGPVRDGIQLELRSPTALGAPSWGVFLRLSRGRAWLNIGTTPGGIAMHGRDESEGSPLPFEPDTLEWVRQGSVLEARLRSGDKTAVVGRYQGPIPPTLDFWIAAFQQESHASFDIEELRIEPLIKAFAYSQVLPRPGAPLGGGGRKLGGFLWSPQEKEKPALRFKIGSLQAAPSTLTLKCFVTNTSGQVLWKRDVPVNLAARQEKVVAVNVPVNRYGSFLFVRQLVDAKGNPLEARQSTRFGITRAPLPEQISDSSFGIHQAHAARIGAKWQRYWDVGGPFWNNTEPEPGKWTWQHSDGFVQRTLAAKMKPLYVLCGPPAWAASKPERGTYMGMGALSPPKDLSQWSNYVREVAARYKGRVTHYELWNEPNSNGLDPEGFFFQGSVEQYFELLKATHAALKSADPNAKLLAPSGTGHFFPWLQRLVELGGLKYFDILSIHTYTQPFPPEIGYGFNGEKSYAHRVGRSREIMAAGGTVKPIWNTEIGFQWRATRGGLSLSRDEIAAEALPDAWPNWSKGWSFRPTDARLISAFTARFYLLSLALGVQKTFYHATLMEQEDGSPSEEAAAYGAASWLLSNAKFDREYPTPQGTRALGFTRSDGKYLLAFWRVEDESLTMDREREKSVSNVGSAPLASANQGAIAATLPPPRATYFPRERDVARILTISTPLRGAAPQVLDMWGNESKFDPDLLPISEAPRYVLFWSKPQSLGLKVLAGREVSSAPQPGTVIREVRTGWFTGLRPQNLTPPQRRAGQLTASTSSAIREVKSLEELLPIVQKLSLSQAKAMEDAPTEPSKIVGEGEAQLGGIRWTLPAGVPKRARLALSVRAGDKANADFNFRYEMKVAGKEVAMQPWAAWPIQLQYEGDGYAMTQGIALSEPFAMAPGQVLEVASRRDHGRVYGAWLVAP